MERYASCIFTHINVHYSVAHKNILQNDLNNLPPILFDPRGVDGSSC